MKPSVPAQSTGRRVLAFVGPPAAVFVLFLAVWHAATVRFEIPAYLLPSPVKVLEELRANGETLVRATALTGGRALAGLLFSFAAGVLVAFFFAQSRIVQRSLYPYAIFLQTVPVVAVAPLIVTWFGFGNASVILVAVIISFFPILASGTAGMTDIDENLAELFALNNASRLQTLFKLHVPNSIPYLVNGVRISSGLAVIGAIIGEFFAAYGRDSVGLGYLIYMTSGQLKTAYLFAAILASTLLGLAIFGAATFIGRAAVSSWKEL